MAHTHHPAAAAVAIKPRRAKTKAAVKAKATVIADAPVTASAVAAVGDAGEAEAAVPAPDVAPARSSLVKKSKRAVRVSSEVTAR